MALPFTDDFERAPPLGANWVAMGSYALPTISSGDAVPVADDDYYVALYDNGGSFVQNIAIDITIADFSHTGVNTYQELAGVISPLPGDPDYYWIVLIQDSGGQWVRVERYDNDGFVWQTEAIITGAATPPGTVITAALYDGHVALRFNNVLLTWRKDTTLPAYGPSKAGIGLYEGVDANSFVESVTVRVSTTADLEGSGYGLAQTPGALAFQTRARSRWSM